MGDRASLLEVSFMLLELSVMLFENIYSTGVTDDDCGKIWLLPNGLTHVGKKVSGTDLCSNINC